MNAGDGGDVVDNGTGTSPNASMWKAVSDRETVSARIEQQVTALVNTKQLKPGDRLPPERELSTLLGVSRPSLREAVRSLQAQGMLQVRHGQGVYVVAPMVDRTLRSRLEEHEHTLSDLFAMRELLEVPATGWTAERRDQAFVSIAEQALDEVNAAASRDPVDFQELGRLDARFHVLIVEAAGNRFLQQTVGVLQDLIASGMQTTLDAPGRLERSRADHERILEAIRAGDPVAARRAARTHIRAAHRAALKRVEAERARVDPGASIPSP